MAIYLSEKKEKEKEERNENCKSSPAGKKKKQKTHYWLLTDIVCDKWNTIRPTLSDIPFSATSTLEINNQF